MVERGVGRAMTQGEADLFTMWGAAPGAPVEPVEEASPPWTRRDSRNWDAAMRFMAQHPELRETGPDPRDYQRYWEPDRGNSYHGWEY